MNGNRWCLQASWRVHVGRRQRWSRKRSLHKRTHRTRRRGTWQYAPSCDSTRRQYHWRTCCLRRWNCPEVQQNTSEWSIQQCNCVSRHKSRLDVLMPRLGLASASWLLPRPCLGLDVRASALPRGIWNSKLRYDIIIYNFHPFILLSVFQTFNTKRHKCIKQRFLDAN